MEFHQPVLLTETINLLKPSPGKIFIDATLGNGGHTLELLKKGAFVYGIDQDNNNIEITKKRLKKLFLLSNFQAIHDNFFNLKSIYFQSINQPIDGIIFDLGLSINQLKSQGRGFSFNDTQSLDMRLDPTSQALTASDVINHYPVNDLYQIFSKFAQEKHSRFLANLIVNNRPLTSTKQLSDLILGSTIYNLKSKINPATKIIMALRIYVNQEFDHLNQALESCLDILTPSAIVAIISFHSGEDRLVKKFINSRQISNLTSPAIHPSLSEINTNPLARSATLRAFALK